MKNAKRFVAFMTAMVLSSSVFVGCGSGNNTTASTTADEKKPSKDGWNEDKNKTHTIENLSYSIPDYYGDEEKNNLWYLEKGRETTMFQVTSVKTTLPNSITEDYFDEVYKAYLQGMENSGTADIEAGSISTPKLFNIAGYDSCVVYCEGNAHSGMVRNVKFENYLVLIADTETQSIVYFDLLQSKEAKYDYVDDFDKVLDSISLTNSSDNSSSENYSANEDENSISNSASQESSTSDGTSQEGSKSSDVSTSSANSGNT